MKNNLTPKQSAIATTIYLGAVGVAVPLVVRPVMHRVMRKQVESQRETTRAVIRKVGDAKRAEKAKEVPTITTLK